MLCEAHQSIAYKHYYNEMPLKIRFYHGAHLPTFTDHPTSAVILDSWQERWPKNHTNFNSFNMQTKNFFESSEIITDKHFVSDTPSWLINKPIVNYDILFNYWKNDVPALINSDVVLEDVLGLEDVLEDRFVKSLALASTVLSLALASALLGFGFCAVLGSRTRYF